MTTRVYPWRIELNDGAWAQFRDPKTVTRAKQRAYKLTRIAIPKEFFDQLERDEKAPLTVEWQELLWAAQDAATMMVLSDWSFDMPVALESLDLLEGDPDEPMSDYALIARAASAVINDIEFYRNPDDAPKPEPPAAPAAEQKPDATHFDPRPTPEALGDELSPTTPSPVLDGTGEGGPSTSDPTMWTGSTTPS